LHFVAPDYEGFLEVGRVSGTVFSRGLIRTRGQEVLEALGLRERKTCQVVPEYFLRRCEEELSSADTLYKKSEQLLKRIKRAG